MELSSWIRRDESDVATGVNYGVASTMRWSKSMQNLKTGIMTIRGPLKTTASSFHRRTRLKGATGAMGAVPTWLVEGPPMYLTYPSMIGWSIVVGCTGNSSVRKVTHPSTIPAIGSSTSEFP